MTQAESTPPDQVHELGDGRSLAWCEYRMPDGSPVFYFHGIPGSRIDNREDLVGSAYRSEIFYTSDKQRRVAEETIPDVDASGHWPGKVVTKITGAGTFWEAEADEQDWFQRYPDGCMPPFQRPGCES